MTSYTAIADTEIDAESPVTEELMTRLRDNPIAIGEGATGAPRIWGSGVARPQDMPVLTVAAASTVDVSTSCDVTTGTTSTNSPTYTAARTWLVHSVTGSVRISATLTSSGGAQVNARAYKNGVQQGSTTSTNTATSVSWDVTTVPTDTLELRHSSDNVGTNSVISSIFLGADDGYVVRSPYVAYSDKDVE
jgi:hypothetical protein